MKADDRAVLLATTIIAGVALLALARHRRRKQQPQVLGAHAARPPPDTQQPQETQEPARLLSVQEILAARAQAVCDERRRAESEVCDDAPECHLTALRAEARPKLY